MRSWGVRLAVREGVEEREKGQGRRCRGTRGRGERKVVSELEDGCCGVQGVCVSGYAAARSGYGRARSCGRRHFPSLEISAPKVSWLAAGWLASFRLLRPALSTLTTHHSSQTLFRLPCSPSVAQFCFCRTNHAISRASCRKSLHATNTSYPPPYGQGPAGQSMCPAALQHHCTIKCMSR